MKKSLLIST